MASAHIILSLIKAGAAGDKSLFRRATEALIADERAKRHDVLAERLEQEWSRASGNGSSAGINGRSLSSPGQILDLIIETTPRRGLSDLVLTDQILLACRELIEEHHRADLLRSHNLEPRHKVLLIGPPGNGKTSLAEAIATELMVPFLTVRYEGLVGSYLGETASRLRRVFDYARTRACVLFFDEFDTLGKERGDVHETGEIKRVVSSLLLQIDELPPHVVVVTATNHPELLDRAVWRRFQLRFDLGPPTRSQIAQYLRSTQARLKVDLGPAAKLAEQLCGKSFAELEALVLDIARRHVLAEPGADVRAIVRSRLRRRTKRSRR